MASCGASAPRRPRQQITHDLDFLSLPNSPSPAPRLPGRLVVPREEWVHLDARTHPVLQFFYSLVPWYVPPRAPQ